MLWPVFQVSDEILQVCSPLNLGYLHGRINNKVKEEILWNEMNDLVSILTHRSALDQVSKIPAIAATREAYKKLGKDPSRYRPSAEALLRRVIQGKGLYQLNGVVDLINYISLQSGYSIGGYDAAKLSGSLTLRKGRKNEVFQAIGRGMLNIDGLPVLCDDKGPIGSPTSDTVRTSISVDTQHVLIVFFGFAGNENLQEWVDIALERLAAFSGAEHLQGGLLGFRRSD